MWGKPCAADRELPDVGLLTSNVLDHMATGKLYVVAKKGAEGEVVEISPAASATGDPFTVTRRIDLPISGLTGVPPPPNELRALRFAAIDQKYDLLYVPVGTQEDCTRGPDNSCLFDPPGSQFKMFADGISRNHWLYSIELPE
jgi:hypothetical protein